MNETAIVSRLNDDRLIGRYIDFLIELAPKAENPIAILERIERAMAVRHRLEADLGELAES